MTELAKAFETIKQWSEKNLPDAAFNPPATREEINWLAENIEPRLPDDLVTFLQIANGERWNSAGVIGNWRLLEIKFIQDEWGFMAKMAQDGSFGQNTGDADPSPYIKNYWWNPQWIPIVTSGSGHFFCLDTDPPEPDRFGQVILFLHDDESRYLVASSLTAWFERIARDLESGLYKFDPDEGQLNGEAFMWSSLEGKHLYSSIPGRRIV